MLRVGQVAWVLDYLDDIASDMSVFHRVDDISDLPGPLFFKRAHRLTAYQGVMQARANETAAEAERPAAGQQSYSSGTSRQDINPGAKATLMAEPAFQGVFSFG